ncbi:flavodoxin [Pseudomonas luteola]
MKVAILCGSVYGTAEEVARHAKQILEAGGHEVWLNLRGGLDDLLAFDADAFLAVTSTTGMGELPDNVQPLYYALRDTLPDWRGRPAAVIGLGDASYGDTYCGGGMQMQELFAELGLQEVLPILKLDASETVTPETDAEPWLDRLITTLIR